MKREATKRGSKPGRKAKNGRRHTAKVAQARKRSAKRRAA